MKSASPLSIILLASTSTTACPVGKHLWKLSLTTDANPSQTSWELHNGKGKLIGAYKAGKYEPLDVYEHSSCLNPGVFTFIIRDDGDGLCCEHGQGGYILTVDDVVIRKIEEEYMFEIDEFQFEVVTSSTTTSSTASSVGTVAAIDPIQKQEMDALYNTTEIDQQDWTNFDYSHSKFCGPKIVGGYDIAVSQCGPATICGLSTKNDHYGSSGNDCPQGLMCYADIQCGNGPGESAISTSLFDEFIYDEINSTVGISGKPIVSEVKNIMTMTNRGSYCGSSYQEALGNCSPDTHCSTDNDCISGFCFADISCTYSGEDIADVKKDGEKGESVIVSSMLEDAANFASRNEVRLHLIGLVIVGLVATFI